MVEKVGNPLLTIKSYVYSKHVQEVSFRESHFTDRYGVISGNRMIKELVLYTIDNTRII